MPRNALILTALVTLVVLAAGGCPAEPWSASTLASMVLGSSAEEAVSHIDPLRFDLPKQFSVFAR